MNDVKEIPFMKKGICIYTTNECEPIPDVQALTSAEYMLESIDPETVSFVINGSEVSKFQKETLLSLSRMFIQFYSEGF